MTTAHKYLGVQTVDEKLSWDFHVMCKKLAE